jgi:hypothetical protein
MTHHSWQDSSDEGSAQRRDLYRTTHDILKRQASMRAAEFETATPANERQQSLALDLSATAVGTEGININQTSACSSRELRYLLDILITHRNFKLPENFSSARRVFPYGRTGKTNQRLCESVKKGSCDPACSCYHDGREYLVASGLCTNWKAIWEFVIVFKGQGAAGRLVEYENIV